jgi:hypothetical protein
MNTAEQGFVIPLHGLDSDNKQLLYPLAHYTADKTPNPSLDLHL